MAVGSTLALTFTGNATATASVSITGPAVFTSAGVGHALADSKTVDLAAADAGSVADGDGGLMRVSFTGTGAVQIALDDVEDNTLYFIVQASCASDYDASRSRAQLNTTAGATATSSIDASGSTSRAYAASGQYGYLDIILNDAYGNALSTTNTAKIATVTGGCTVNWDATATTGTTTAVDPAAASDATEDLVIIGDNTPRTCTVTVTFGNTTVATKTVRMLGEVASLTVDPSNSGTIWGYGVNGTTAASETGANANKIIYVAKDSAGNVVNISAPSLSGATNGASQCTVADGAAYPAASATTNGVASLDVDCTNSTVRGSAVFQLATTRSSDGVSVKSNVLSVQVNKSTHTFKASWDKAVYNIGDIMTLTIEGLDDAGNSVYDGWTAGADVAVNVSGATRLSAAPATGDKYSKGKITYQYSAGDTAVQYGWNALVTSGSGQSAVVGTYTIKDPNGGVSNADVLKSIVSLIASINKQIQALQKLILRR